MADHEHHDHEDCDSCDDVDDSPMESGDTNSDELNKPIDITADGGIKKTILRAGTGWAKPPKASDVTVHYVGTLLDGTEFDSSRGRNEPFQFKLGVGQVIKGWDQGVATMKKGELAELLCTAPYAYGEAGSPPKIPAGATLKFEVELISWVDEKDISAAKDGSLMKKTVKEGEGWETPGDDATVTVRYVARHSATGAEISKTAEEGLTFAVGEEQAPTAALDLAVQSMKKGETSLVTSRDDQTTYECTLVEFSKSKMVYEMSGAELLEGAEAKRVEGNALYKQGKTARALRRYKKAVEYLEADYKLSDEEKKQARAGKVSCYLNVAACKIAEKDWKEAIVQCDKALAIESGNVRALVRRGKAYAALDDWETAERDFGHALEIDAANVDAAKEMAALKRRRAEADKKIKARLQGMFSRMAKLEEQEEKQRMQEEALLAQQRAAEEEAAKLKKETESAAMKTDATEQQPAPVEASA